MVPFIFGVMHLCDDLDWKRSTLSSLVCYCFVFDDLDRKRSTIMYWAVIYINSIFQIGHYKTVAVAIKKRCKQYKKTAIIIK